MKMDEIRTMADDLGVVNAAKLKKPQLIRAIQDAEGFAPSFGDNDSSCPHIDCCWWEDCLKENQSRDAVRG